MLFLDIFLTIVHLTIVLFNLFGWIPKRTRKAHLVSLILTAASWFILGIWYGLGYCPVTEWQWRVKERLGETNLPNNFIEYFLEKITGHDFSSSIVGNLIAVCFAIAVALSLFVNFILPRLKKGPQVLR
jgi:hypothetical protein